MVSTSGKIGPPPGHARLSCSADSIDGSPAMVVFTRRAFTALKESLGAEQILALRDAKDDDILLHSQFLQNRQGGDKKFFMAFTERLDLVLFWRRLPSGEGVWIVDDA